MELEHIESICDLPIPPELTIWQILSISTCDFRWTGENQRPIITIFAELSDVHPFTKRFVTAWDVGIGKDKELVLLRERQPVRLPSSINVFSDVKDVHITSFTPAGIYGKLIVSYEYTCRAGGARTVQYALGITDEENLKALLYPVGFRVDNIMISSISGHNVCISFPFKEPWGRHDSDSDSDYY